MLLSCGGCLGPVEGDRNLLQEEEPQERVVNLFSPMEKTSPNLENVARSAFDKTIALAEERVRWNEEEDNLLEKCTAAYHDQEHEFSIIYGDYYFLEALMKLNGRELFIW